MTQYILTTKEGAIYRGPDGMPFIQGTRSGIARIAAKQGLTDWKSQPVSLVELADIRRDCLRSLAPIAYARVTGI